MSDAAVPTSPSRGSSLNRVRPLRSILWATSAWPSADLMREEVTHGADSVVLDLEDGVPPTERPATRERLAHVVPELGGAGQVVFVRVNAVGTDDIAEDIDSVVCEELHGVFIPKVNRPEEIAAVGALLTEAERRKGLPIGHTLVNPLLETASANRLAYEIACASPRIAYMGAGITKDGDPAASIGYEWTPEGTETLYIRSKVLLDVRAAGVRFPTTAMWSLLDDIVGLRRYATQCRQIGYVGVHVSRPHQLPVVHEVLTPSVDEIRTWTTVFTLLLQEHRSTGRAKLEYRGTIIGPNKVRYGSQRLELARAYGVLDGARLDALLSELEAAGIG